MRKSVLSSILTPQTEIKFDPEHHIYMVGGKVIKSVNQILDLAGLQPMFVKPDKLARAGDLGTNIHLATQLYDMGDLDENSLDPDIYLQVQAYKKFRSDTHVRIYPEAIECMVYNRMYGFCGTFDRIIKINGKFGLLDIKSGQLAKWTGLQLAAYVECLRRRIARYAIQLKPNGTYNLKEYTDPQDINVFLSALTVVNWKGEN